MSVSAVAPDCHSVNPYIMVRDAAALIAFCEATFGARVTEQLHDGDRITHLQLLIGDSTIMAGQATGADAPASLYVYVEDCDAAYARAIAAGATSIMAPATMYYGDRHGGVTDTNGNTWWIATHVEDMPLEELVRRHEAAMAQRKAAAT